MGHKCVCVCVCVCPCVCVLRRRRCGISPGVALFFVCPFESTWKSTSFEDPLVQAQTQTTDEKGRN